MVKSKSIRVKYKKLGKHKAHGFAYPERKLIEIDERLRGKKLLEILIHEAYHIVNPDESEEETERKSIAITKLLWQQGFRKIDNEENVKFQDGTK